MFVCFECIHSSEFYAELRCSPRDCVSRQVNQWRNDQYPLSSFAFTCSGVFRIFRPRSWNITDTSKRFDNSKNRDEVFHGYLFVLSYVYLLIFVKLCQFLCICLLNYVYTGRVLFSLSILTKILFCKIIRYDF